MVQQKKRKVLPVLLGIGAVILLLCLVVLVLFWNELRSLSTLKKVDEYGMYQMTYYGDYGFDEFLQTGASDDGDIEAFVTKRLLKGLPIDLGVTGDGCTAFVVKNNDGDILYGRNFDFDYAPSLQVYTAPDHGYASVSTVNLAYAGYGKEYLPDGSLFHRFLTLAAPFLPFDGMNEKGVAMALLAVPEAHPSFDPNRVTLNTTTAIRLVLDQAATVEEAVMLLRQYNMYFSGDVDCHYLIADASGHSVIVEYYDQALQVVETDREYQIASNFIAYNGLNIGEGGSEFTRYDKVQSAIEANGCALDAEQALVLLADIGIREEQQDRLQWTALYNLTTGDSTLFANRKLDHRLAFHLTMHR